MTHIRKAVLPVAGMGTRFLPATKSIPKEMLPLVDRPLIQYAIDEARQAGIEEFIFVTAAGKGALEGRAPAEARHRPCSLGAPPISFPPRGFQGKQ